MPLSCSNFFVTISMAISDWSTPIQFLPQISAANNVEPEPQKQSITIESIFEDASTMNFNISRFFSVGYVGFTGSLNSHISCAFLLVCSSA